VDFERNTARFEPADFDIGKPVSLPFFPSEMYKNEKSRFKYLMCIGKAPIVKKFPNDSVNFTISYNEYFLNWDPNKTSLFSKKADHHAVRATQETMNISINKMDAPKVFPDPTDDPDMRRTLALVLKYLHYMEDSVDPLRELEFNGAASPGIGYAGTKADALESEQFKRLFPSISHVPVDTLNSKSEDLAMEDHDRKKVRTVFCSPIDFVAKEKIIFGGQNEKLKLYHRNSWIKYGCVKQYGGFDAVFKEVEKFTLNADSDCSGWDRKIFLFWVYYIRIKLLTNAEQYKELINYVSFFNIHGTVLLPDGHIYLRETGCNSGKNNTTTDNCIAHLIIMFYFFVVRCRELGKTATLTTILNNAFFPIYSDDKTGGCDPAFWDFTIETFKEFERKIYAKFGLEVKESQQFVSLRDRDSPVNPKHSFLGSYAYFNTEYSMYIPYPREGKICSSFVNRLPDLSIDLLFRRFLVLTALLWPCPELFSEAVSLTKFFMSKHPEENTLFQMILEEHTLDLDVESEFLRLYIGFEAGPFNTFFNFFKGKQKSITNEIWKFENCYECAKQWINLKPSNSDENSLSPVSGCPQGGSGWVA